MDIYFLRHGKAAELGDPGVTDDFSRELTPKGIEEIEAQAAVMERLGVAPDAILSSPLARAKQTAELVAKGLGRKKSLLVSDALAPGCDLERLGRLVAQHASAKSLLVVGHEPDLSTMIGELVGRGGARVEMKKGGLARVELRGSLHVGAGMLVWLVPPRVLLGGKD
jgi:phosphohistidine phosphatase